MKSLLCLIAGLAVLTSASGQVLILGGGTNSTETDSVDNATAQIFISATGQLPPSPFDPLPDLPFYRIGTSDEYVYDDRNYNYEEAEAAANSSMPEASTTSAATAATSAKSLKAQPMFGFQNGVAQVTLRVQGSNAVLTWPSSPGNLFLVESEGNLLNGLAISGIPWVVLTNGLLAGSGSQTSFTDPNPVVYPTNVSGGGGGGGGNGPPPPGGTNSGNGAQVSGYGSANFYRVLNVTPTAGQPIFAIAENSGASQLNIFQNAFDPNASYLFVTNVTSAHHGSINYSTDGSTFQYTPNANFYGVDSFSFTIIDSYGGYSTGTATVYVTEYGDAALSVTNQIFVLADNVYSVTFNAITNASPSSCTLCAVSTPLYGTITTNTLGQITYTRNTNFFGADSFSYAVTDGKGGYAAGTMQVQQFCDNTNGLPDQWEIAYAMNPAIDNSMADPDGDGVPNLAEFILGTNPLIPDNPLNFPGLTNGTVLTGFVQLPLIGINPFVSPPPLVLYVNGAPNANASVAQGPDGTWAFNWDTTYLNNGVYSVQAQMQYGNCSAGPLYSLYGALRTFAITNSLTFNPLASQFSEDVYIEATCIYPNANYQIYLYDDYGDPLASVSGTANNGVIYPGPWNLNNGQYSSGNVLALFELSGQGVPTQYLAQWWYREGSAGAPSFAVAWGWDAYDNKFLGQEQGMISSGIVNYLANPLTAYTMTPSGPPAGFWNHYDAPNTMFRYDTDSDKQILTNALAQSLCFCWQGHGGPSAIMGNADKSNLGCEDVRNALQNMQFYSNPKHPRTNAHPYKLVVLNGCDTDSPQWSKSFGIDYDNIGTTNYVASYTGVSRVPRAFVGWTGFTDAPSDYDYTGAAHNEFAAALGNLWNGWMSGDYLIFSLQNFAESATNNGFAGQGNWHISGCVDLQRGD